MRVRFIVYYENSYEKHFERPRVADSGITLYPYSDLRTVGVDTTSACQVLENDINWCLYNLFYQNYFVYFYITKYATLKYV